MDKENYNSMQIVSNFNVGITEWEIFDTDRDNTTDLIQNYIGEENDVNVLTENSPFFLAMKPPEKIKNNIWYYQLREFMSHWEPILRRNATNLSQVSNHSAGKASPTTLLNNTHTISCNYLVTKY